LITNGKLNTNMNFKNIYELCLENDVDYRGEHTAPDPESGAPAYDLTINGIYPPDVYSMPSWYESGEGLDELRKILRWRNNPEHKTKIFRAVPISVYKELMKQSEKENSSFTYKVFNNGDWVSTNLKYAKDHGRGALQGNFKVVGLYTSVKNIFTNGDSIMEWGYYKV
jgi:hypothetical protein